jgi:hypothetical protein
MDKSNAAQWAHAANLARSLLRGFKFALAALAIGSRMVPLGDNRQLVRDFAARAARLYGDI